MKDEIDKALENRDIRPTAMRRLVYQVLSRERKAMSLVEIEQQFENVDRSTVFRTLKTFRDHLLIHGVDDGSGSVKYALCDEDCTCTVEDQHYHFYCVKCGQTYCLKDMPIPPLRLPEGFQPENVNFVIKGICPNCQ